MTVFVGASPSSQLIGDEVVAAHGGDRDWVRELPEMEWTSHESICIYDA